MDYNGGMKKSYTVEHENIIFRRARIDDNFKEIADLIYFTDPYIYPFWFQGDLGYACEFLVEHIAKPGFIFYFENIYVAYDKTTDHIVGIICAIDRNANLDFDYEQIKTNNQNHKITIEGYIERIIAEAKENDYLYISNVCIAGDYRGKKIGTRLLGHYLGQMEKAGFHEFALDCLLHNLRAKNLYHNLGFIEIAEYTGFDGTADSQVEAVSMRRRQGAYLPEEFQALG